MNNTNNTLSLKPLPLKLSTQTSIDNVFCKDTFKVAVNYYVLRSPKKENS